jgi:hypothetical protein
MAGPARDGRLECKVRSVLRRRHRKMMSAGTPDSSAAVLAREARR